MNAAMETLFRLMSGKALAEYRAFAKAGSWAEYAARCAALGVEPSAGKDEFELVHHWDYAPEDAVEFAKETRRRGLRLEDVT